MLYKIKKCLEVIADFVSDILGLILEAISDLLD